MPKPPQKTPSLEGFDPMPRLTEIAPTNRAAVILCRQDDRALGLTALRIERDEETGADLLDSLADAERYLSALAVVVANAEQRLLAAIAD